MDIQKLIHTLRPFGDVLEIGFGSASKEIEKYRPRTHTIVSTDPKASAWAKDHEGVKVIQDVWQGALPELGVFDTIFFGIDPVEGGFLIRYQYTDSELDLFCASVGEKKYLSKFLAELERNGQITHDQKEKMIHKYKLAHANPPPQKRSGEMVQFLKHCLSTHMRKGSRFSCTLKSELDDPIFFNEIAVDPFLDVRLDGMILVIEKL
ncbi:MAG: hypothetical protein K1X28_10325 [Parachlamydiales bacterium]|nr:hypothetical protein [Parachlamydiales bacterium]